jgi:predicted extracellular nuclease
MAAYVYRVTPKKPETFVLADSKSDARKTVSNQIEVERLTTEEVMDLYAKGIEILNPKSQVVDPDQQDLPIPAPGQE